MGTVSISVTALLALFGIVAFIGIFPEKLCVPFTDTCLFLTPIHQLKNTLQFVTTVFLLFALITIIVLLIVKFFQFFKRNRFVKYAVMFLMTFDHDYWVKLRKSL